MRGGVVLLRGFYTAASGMIAQQRHQEFLSNNIANANTPGYKADQASLRSFPEMLLQQSGKKTIPTVNNINLPLNHTIGPINTGAYVQEGTPNFAQGDIRETGISSDLALINRAIPDETGSFFFTVQDEQGEARLTRNGNFTVDAEGFLVTNQGYYVLDNNGNSIQTNGMEFNVNENGILQTEFQAFQLGISYVADANTLTKEGNDLFQGEADALPVDANFVIQQGVLEQSNVDSLQSMTQMMESYRLFETNQRVLRAYDESMGKAVNEVGRLG